MKKKDKSRRGDRKMVKKAAVTKEYTHVTHPFPALYNKESEILILGSLPSVKSRE